MAARIEFSVLDLLDLPPAEREVFLELARGGPRDAPALAVALGMSPAELQVLLSGLKSRGRLRFAPDGTVDVQMGHIGSRTTLPPAVWPALLAPQRLYTEQEIAILKIAIPMLQFVRATLSSFADHGPQHALRVKTFATQLGYALGLSETERRLLRTAALFHDIGNVIERERHHVISQETVEKLMALGNLPLSAKEVELVGLLCRWHRKEYEPEKVDTLRGEPVRIGMAASILRVADAMDIDSRRSDYDKEFRVAMEFFFPEKRPFFTSLEEIYGVRVVCRANVNIQVFTRGIVRENMQIEQLYRDLGATPLGWSVQPVGIPSTPAPQPKRGSALVAFPFDAHSIVMTALSRRNLSRAGYAVELMSYPDTPDGGLWLWQNALGGMDGAAYQELVVIGDRPHQNSEVHLFNTVDRWQAAGARVHLLNRYEANWTRIPELRARGVTVTLGTDWAYFWGDPGTPSELEWAMLAALTTRDPTMAAVSLSPGTEKVMRGLLGAVLDAEQSAEQSGAQDISGWLKLAEPILDRIAGDDRAYFVAQADQFVKHYATPTRSGRVQGRVLVFEDAPGDTPQAFYWLMEAAMEQSGITSERELRLRVPYAIATRVVGEQVELVAMNHWRAVNVTPIRLLYPDVGPPPQGTESTLTVRLSPGQSEIVVLRLLEACNKD